jgi:dienelactone hydrolase
MMRLWRVLLGVAAAMAGPAWAETVILHSTTYASVGAALQHKGAKPAQVPADFQLPSHAAGRYPAVVVVHTIGGYDAGNEGWFAARLREAGFATLTYDSFSARHWGKVTKGNDLRLSAAGLADAFAALEFLSTQPKIDPARIAVIGFSLGGGAAHAAAFTAARKALSPDHRFAAHVAFYPSWTFGSVGRPGAYTGAPVLLLFGEKDENDPPEKVRSYFDYLAKTGTQAPIETKTYPGAHHAWTNPRFAQVHFYADHGSTRKCPLRLMGSGLPKLLIGGAARDFDAALWAKCRREGKGYAMGFDAAARVQSLKDMLAFLNRHIGK